jgi:hypothetical protein
VEATNELSRAHQPPVGEADRRGAPSKTAGLEVAQDGVHEVRAGVSRSANGVADARDADGLAPTVERLLAPARPNSRSQITVHR